MAKVKIVFKGGSAVALHSIAKITGRPVHLVVCDALNAFDWILEQQLSKKKIVAMNGDPSTWVELEQLAS